MFHNGSKYDFHLIIKELANEFGTDIQCIAENMENHITFNAPLKVHYVENIKITCKLKLIDSMRFMNTSIARLTDNLSELNNKSCKKCKERKNLFAQCKFIKVSGKRLKYQCTKYQEISYKPIKGLINNFPNIYMLSKGDLNKFILLLRKGICP